MFDKVIVGVDGRPGGRDAVALATRLVAPGGELLQAHVCRDGEGAFEHESSAMLERDYNATDVRRRFASVEASTVSSGLKRLVEEHEADLLVLGSCRRGLAGSILLGDDTRASLHDLACAAAIAPRGYAEERASIALVGVAYDGTLAGETTVALAQSLASDLRAEVRALTAIALPPAAYAEPASLGYIQGAPFAATEVGDALVQRAERRLAELDVVGLVVCGPPGLELESFSDDVDLLVLGSSHKGRLGRLLLGSVTNHLAHASHCPLLLLSRAQSETAGEQQLAGAAAVPHPC